MRHTPTDPAEVEEHLWADATGDVAWDVGAHEGESVQHLLDRGFTTILTFEPALESYEKLIAGYGHELAVRTFGMAISDHTGKLTLSERAVPVQGGQLTAMEMPYADYAPGTPLTGTLPWGPEVGTRQVECETLDRIYAQYGKPDFVKVDCEGSEGAVLDGAVKVLAEAKPRFMIEFHTQRLQEKCARRLGNNGYTVETVRHPHYPEGAHMWSEHGWIKAHYPGNERQASDE